MTMNDNDAIAMLKMLVETPSVSRFERPAVERLRETATRAGLIAGIDGSGSFVASSAGDPIRGGTETDIVLLGHIDTVPGYVPVRQEGDLFYGRGSVDAKGPLAAFVAAAARLRDRLPAGVRVVVIGAVEEEIATSKGARAAVSRYRPGACVIGEPSGAGAVTLGYKGRLLCRCRVTRSVVHTAGPGLSVADEVHAWWNRVIAMVAELNAGKSGAFGVVQATLRSFDTGSDGLMDRAEAVAGFRLPPGVEPSELEAVCQRAAAAETDVEFMGAEEAYVGGRENGLVRAFTTAIRAGGQTPRLLTKTGTSDMNVVGPVWGRDGVPVVAYGPGDSKLDHTPIEHISLNEFVAGVSVLERAILRWAGGLAGERVSGAVEAKPLVAEPVQLAGR